MDKFLAVSKNIILDDYEKFNFVFMDKSSLIIFKENNPKLKAFEVNEIDVKNSEFFIGDKEVYLIHVLPKILFLGAKKIYLYDEKIFPKQLNFVDMSFGLEVDVEKKDSTVIIDTDLINKVKIGTVLAHKIVSLKPKYVAVSNKIKDIYITSGAIKALNKDIKIILFGKTDTPIKDLMTNPVDFLLKDEEFLPNKEMYSYDENMRVVLL
jgi:hypothetical protein